MASVGGWVSDQCDSKQVELLEMAKEKNIIVYLGTGSGKTFIAAMLMKHMKDKLLGGLQKVKASPGIHIKKQKRYSVSKTYLSC